MRVLIFAFTLCLSINSVFAGGPVHKAIKEMKMNPELIERLTITLSRDYIYYECEVDGKQEFTSFPRLSKAIAPHENNSTCNVVSYEEYMDGKFHSSSELDLECGEACDLPDDNEQVAE